MEDIYIRNVGYILKTSYQFSTYEPSDRVISVSGHLFRRNRISVVGDINIISFSIESRIDEIFEVVVQKAINRLRELDPSLEDKDYQISTASADLIVKKMYYSKILDEVISIYG